MIEMWPVREDAHSLVFWPLWDSIAETVLVTRPCLSTLVVLNPYETNSLLSSGPLVLPSEVNLPTILQSFEDHHVLYSRKFLEETALTARSMALWCFKRKFTGNMTELTTKIQLLAPPSDGMSSKAGQPTPPIVPQEGHALDTAISAANKKLSKNARSTFSMLLEALKALLWVKHTDSTLLTQSHKVETRDSQLWNWDLV